MHKLKPWPQDWTAHIVNSFKLYLSNKHVKFIRSFPCQTVVTDATPQNTKGYTYTQDMLSVDLEIYGETYNLKVEYDKKEIICYLYRFKEKIIEEIYSYTSVVFDDIEMYFVAVFNPVNCFALIKATETIIICDYNYRFGEDDEDGEDFEPIVPMPSLPDCYTPLPSIS